MTVDVSVYEIFVIGFAGGMKLANGFFVTTII